MRLPSGSHECRLERLLFSFSHAEKAQKVKAGCSEYWLHFFPFSPECLFRRRQEGNGGFKNINEAFSCCQPDGLWGTRWVGDAPCLIGWLWGHAGMCSRLIGLFGENKLFLLVRMRMKVKAKTDPELFEIILIIPVIFPDCFFCYLMFQVLCLYFSGCMAHQRQSECITFLHNS